MSWSIRYASGCNFKSNNMEDLIAHLRDRHGFPEQNMTNYIQDSRQDGMSIRDINTQLIQYHKEAFE